MRLPLISRAELIVSRNYRMPIYWTFQLIEKKIVSTLILIYFVFFPPKILQKSKNSANSPKIQNILRKIAEISVNSPKIPQEGIFWGHNNVSISYWIKNQISYRVEKKAYHSGVLTSFFFKCRAINFYWHKFEFWRYARDFVGKSKWKSSSTTKRRIKTPSEERLWMETIILRLRL